MAIHRTRLMTVEEYFDFEETSEIRHEYIDGEIYPMTGGTVHHDSLIVNTIVALWQRVSRSGCQVHGGHVRHSISPARYLYPDVSVVCGDQETDDRSLNLFNPALVAEVISPNTASKDRGEKRHLYQSIDTLQVYLLIDQDQPHVVVDSRQDDRWHTQEYAGLDAIVPLPALNCDLPLAEIYAGIEV